MAQGTHLSQAELDEMERRKRQSTELGEVRNSEPLPGEHEQESDRTATGERTRLIDPVITANPD